MPFSKKYLKTFFLFRLFLFFISIFWLIGFISPCIRNSFLNSNYPILKLIYSTVCHQNPEKSFTCSGAKFLVCSRCTGIYIAVLITSFVTLFQFRSLKIKTFYLILFSLPMLADVIFYSIGFYSYNKIIAATTGFLFGSAVFLYILNAIENSFIKNDVLK